MTIKKRQNPQRFAPVQGEVYENAGGGKYLCIRSYGWERANMINTVSGWELFAHRIVRYDDGTIEWDCSDGLGFNDGRLAEYREIESRAKKAELRQRQASMLNAMLCCLI